MTATVSALPTRLGRPARAIAIEAARASWADNLTTVGLAFWLIAGVFVDGWAHNNLLILESFFTPWHALLYSGFGASAAWIFWMVIRNHRAGYAGLAAIPRGYQLGLAGVFVFGAAGLGDMAWHIIFGIEKEIDALLSPTHLLLFLGAALVLTSPIRSAWAEPGTAPSFGTFLPTLAAFTFTLSAASFMSMYLWGLNQGYSFLPHGYFQQFARQAGAVQRYTQVAGLSGMIVTNAMLLAPVLYMLRRWRLPFGSVTVMFTANSVLMQALFAFRRPEVVVVGVAAGLAADLLIWLLRPSASVDAFRAFAVAAPVALWGIYFLVESAVQRLGWSTELWSGIVVWNAFGGLALSLLIAPPATPASVPSLHSEV